MHLYGKKREGQGFVIAMLIFFLMAALLFYMLLTVGAQTAEKQQEQLEAALKQACITCYAIEGRYPPNLQYILSNYGITADQERYIVFFDAFAENVMPTVEVLAKEALADGK